MSPRNLGSGDPTDFLHELSSDKELHEHQSQENAPSQESPEEFLNLHGDSKRGDSKPKAKAVPTRKCSRCSSSEISKIKSIISSNAGWKCSSCGLLMRHSHGVVLHVVILVLAVLIGATLLPAVWEAAADDWRGRMTGIFGGMLGAVVAVWCFIQMRRPAPIMSATTEQASEAGS